MSIAVRLAQLTAISLILLAPTMTSRAEAQAWPQKPIRLLVPLAPGSTADIISRTIGNELGKTLGQTVVIENKAGAGGTIATAEVARSKPDGYTIGFASQGTLVFNQALYANTGYDSLKDLTPIALAGGVSNIMIAPPDGPMGSVQGIIETAKSKPGVLTFSSGGSGTSHHLSGVLFGQMTGTNLVHVPYRGAPQGIMAVMSGEVNMGFFNTPTVLSQIRDGKLKALAVTSLERSALLPNLPTLNELGVKNYEVNTWFGWVGPSGLPGDIVERLNREIIAILARTDIRENIASQGFDIAPPTSPDAFGKLVAADLEKWLPVVKQSGAKAD